MTAGTIEEAGYASPVSTGEDIDFKERIKYFESMSEGGLETSGSVTDGREVSVTTEEEVLSEANSVESRFEDVVSVGIDTLGSFNLEEFDKKLNTAEHVSAKEVKEECSDLSELVVNTKENDNATLNESSVRQENNGRSLDYYESGSRIKSRSILAELAELRPASAVFTNKLKPVPAFIPNWNMYDPKVEATLFSKEYSVVGPVVFRTPGIVLPRRPNFGISNYIVTEEGVKAYIRIYCDRSSWYVLKLIRDPEEICSMSDREYASFIIRDVVTSILFRTPYVIYKDEIVEALILGEAICLCRKRRCFEVLELPKAVRRGVCEIAADDVVIRLSCETEREEWMRVIAEVLAS